MLTGKELGAAIRIAVQKKIASGAAKNQREIATHFGVQTPSVHDWMKRGCIGKEKLPELWRFFSDVVGAEHWGLKELPISDPSETAWHAYSSADAATHAAIDLLLLPRSERIKLSAEIQAAIVLIESISTREQKSSIESISKRITTKSKDIFATAIDMKSCK